MSRASTMTEIPANFGSGGSCTEKHASCIPSPIHQAITEIFKSKFPLKTWAHLATLLGLQERAAKYRLAGARAYTVDELQVMLQSEDGINFLVAIMADAEPKWWWWAKQVMTVAAIKRRRAEDEQEILKLETSAPAEHGARRRIKGALDANRRIKAGIDSAETALGFSRPNVDRLGAAADSRGARVPDRAVAQAQGRRR